MRSEPVQPRILFVASGAVGTALRALGAVEARFPDHRVDIVACQPVLERLSTQQRARVVFVAGRRSARLTFLRAARREQYWLVAVLLAGQSGYVSMKLAALLLGVGRVIICYNEHGGAFVLDRRHLRVIAHHLANRLGPGRGQVLQRVLLRGLYSVVGEPVGLCWMLTSIALGRLQGLLVRPGRERSARLKHRRRGAGDLQASNERAVVDVYTALLGHEVHDCATCVVRRGG